MAGLRFDQDAGNARQAQAAFKKYLNQFYGWYAVGFVAFLLTMAVLEQMGLRRQSIGFTFLFAPIALYAGIGVLSRTSDATEYYVAGRRVPAMYNGMATGADWMSAASFIGLAGTLYLSGYGGLAFIMGWTGGYCLVALLLAPYLRKFGQFTIPDFLGARYEGNLPRFIGIVAAILCSFTYVVAQIYGVGLITTRLSGLAFEVGIFVGLGGILVCSFLGGMRAVTWTQVAQYIILLVAYVAPVVWLSVKQTGVPVPQIAYSYQLQKVTEAEKRLLHDPKEREVIAIFKAQANELAGKLKDVTAALASDKSAAGAKLVELQKNNAALVEIHRAERAQAALPRNEAVAREAWTKAKAMAEARAKPLAGMPPHAQPFAGDPNGDETAQRAFDTSRRNFLALVFCLTVGTAALPHVLVRYYTTPSVRQARDSVVWSLFFILLLYVTAPALAVLVKYEIFNILVGTPFDKLPAWISAWSRVDPNLMSVVDINKDGIFQLGEMRLGQDIIVLAAPEIGGMPYVVSGLVAAGGLAAALSTADGLLLTIASAISHDLYYKMVDPNASTSSRVAFSKALLLVVALAAAAVAAQKPAGILDLVSAAFSFAGAAFFPALVLGIFWKRASKWGAVLGMVSGLGITVYYMAMNQDWMRGLFGVTREIHLWFNILPISAGVFGVALGFAVIIVVSLFAPATSLAAHEWVEHVRYPNVRPNTNA